MLMTCIDLYYIRKRSDGDKCLVFVSTSDLCEILHYECLRRYDGLKISKYFKSYGGKLEDILTSDITVTSSGSAGAALDIKGLICVVMEDNKASQRTNLQILGRERVIADRDVYFVWVHAVNIDKHRTYDMLRKNLFRERVKEIIDVSYQIEI